jgi:hypothetical protein
MQKQKSLRELYDAHQGKLSDKWASYLDAYDGALAPYRDLPVRMLEIGIQNGGSLEIWSQYFPRARILIGCDIDPRCAQLRYEDPRIQVVAGDANAPDIRARVLAHADAFDIILDDGSHKSSDIVGSFASYFALLEEGGIYIAEDLHCSYWQDWEGGLFDPQSAMAFFKLLADAINHEHWGVAGQRVDLFTDFTALKESPLVEEVLAQIHSVEFANSLCFIRKRAAGHNRLGMRMIAGTLELVSSGSKAHHHTALLVPDNSGNPRAHRTPIPFAQIYVDTGTGFSEEISIKRPLLSGTQQIVFSGFPADVSVQSLRFDPANNHVAVRIDRVLLVNQGGEQADAAFYSVDAALADGADRYFPCEDPQFLIEVPAHARAGLKEVIVSMEVIACGRAEVAEKLWARQAEILTSREQQIATLEVRIASLEAQLETQVRNLEAHVANREAQIADRNGQIAALEALVRMMLGSTSWRMTAPLRSMNDQARRIVSRLRKQAQTPK